MVTNYLLSIVMSVRIVKDSNVEGSVVTSSFRLPSTFIQNSLTIPTPLKGSLAYNTNPALNINGKIWYADGTSWVNLSSFSPSTTTVNVLSTGAFVGHDFEMVYTTLNGSDQIDLVITDITPGDFNVNVVPDTVHLAAAIPLALRPSSSFWHWGIGHAKNGLADVWVTNIYHIQSNGDIDIYITLDGSSAELWPPFPVLFPINFYTNQVSYTTTATTPPPP